MKPFIRNLLILIMPFMLMVIVNETIRFTGYAQSAGKVIDHRINSSFPLEHSCSWACHNMTGYCKLHHVKHVQGYFSHTDQIYFGLINLLKSTGDYGMANIIVLVVLFPLLMWFFLIRSLSIQDQIKRLRDQHDQ